MPLQPRLIGQSLLNPVAGGPLQEAVGQRWANKDTYNPPTQDKLDATAMALMAVPGVGDVAGLGADMHRFATEPESRTWPNYGMAAMGALPFVPPMVAMTKKMDLSSLKNTKVVDESGKPKMVYHATDDMGLEDFNASRGHAGNFGTKAAAEERLAHKFEDATLEEGVETQVIGRYLDIKNPIRMNDVHFDETSTMAEDLFEKGIFTDADVDAVLDVHEAAQKVSYSAGNYGNDAGVAAIVEKLKKKGYDGIVYKNKIEDMGSDSYIPFDPEQIVSLDPQAIGKKLGETD